jgi:hypothetical protein
MHSRTERIDNEHRTFTALGRRYTIGQHIQGSITYNPAMHERVCGDFIQLVRLLNVSCKADYWIIGGTLLGVIRNQCILPWDIDIDIAITKRGYTRLLRKLSVDESNAHTVLTFVPNMIGFKVYSEQRAVADIFIVDHIDDYNMAYSGPYVNHKSQFLMSRCFPRIRFTYNDIYPLTKRTCCGIRCNVPHNFRKLLAQNYNENVLSEVHFPLYDIHDTPLDKMYVQRLVYAVYSGLIRHSCMMMLRPMAIIARHALDEMAIFIAKMNMAQFTSFDSKDANFIRERCLLARVS